MVGQWPSREETYFPAGNTSVSSSTSDRMGAFGTLQLDHEPTPGSEQQHVSRPSELWRPPTSQRVILPTSNQQQDPRSSITTHSSAGRSHTYGPHQQTSPLLRDSHAPSTSNGSSTGTRRKYAKLSDVVTLSDNSEDLARNLSDYINEKIPYGVSIFFLIILSIIAFVLTLIGVFNIPFCQLQPMIPIWLLVTGLLFIISATLRIYRLIPSPNGRSRTMSLDLCCRGTEAFFLVVNAVWLTLGCIWVYGSKPYVHFEENMFEQHFCDWMLYWTAFWTCTASLIMVCIFIILLIFIMIMVSSKEARENAR
ncbi:hypothetical protein ANCCEY_05928 [Ancylostoma ceylanicum]|uniref:MARVEL domain-containing protein n=2 Tax=Ancylostoma ceylanicum TaxID=53326 RepID=A0A016SC31_9BILA|nr:hypothetical protein ANCCEY_05928 [Ancylostoma ceylanicum]EYB87917.1 hypothetical protein Y032_0255g328 [Ancylostoma ceylanicum]